MSFLADRDPLDPRSRHNIHVSAKDDLRDIPPWSQKTLYQAVRAADAQSEHVVVVDYGRSQLYVVATNNLSYDPPEALGLRTPPVLHVSDPTLFEPDGPKLVSYQSVTVSPEFDILVPAFDWDDLDEEELLPPVDRRPTRSPSSTGTGSPT